MLPEQRRVSPCEAKASPRAQGLVVFQTHHYQHPAQSRQISISAQAGVFRAQPIRRERVGNCLYRLLPTMLTRRPPTVAGTVALIGSRGSKPFGTPVTFALLYGLFSTPRNVRSRCRLHHHSRPPCSSI